MQGIYSITNTVTGKQYVGKSRNIEKRWKNHRRQLQKGSHHSKMLQADWQYYGSDAFVFEIVEVISAFYQLANAEARHIAHLRPAYNYAHPVEINNNLFSPEQTRRERHFNRVQNTEPTIITYNGDSATIYHKTSCPCCDNPIDIERIIFAKLGEILRLYQYDKNTDDFIMIVEERFSYDAPRLLPGEPIPTPPPDSKWIKEL